MYSFFNKTSKFISFFNKNDRKSTHFDKRFHKIHFLKGFLEDLI